MICPQLTTNGESYEVPPNLAGRIKSELDEIISRYLKAIESEIERDPGLFERPVEAIAE